MSEVRRKYWEDEREAIEAAAELAGDCPIQVGRGHYEDRDDGWTYEVKCEQDCLWYIEIRDEDGNRCGDWGDWQFKDTGGGTHSEQSEECVPLPHQPTPIGDDDMRDLKMHERKSHAMFLAQDLEREGVHLKADFDGEGVDEEFKTALEIYDAFTTCEAWWCDWYKGETYLGSVYVIPSNDVDLISDWTISAASIEDDVDVIDMLLKKIGWRD